MPLVDRGSLQGVLVVQTTEPREFSGDEISMLVAATAQLSPLVSELRRIGAFRGPGLRAAAGVGAEPVVVLGSRRPHSLFRELDPVRWRQCDHNPIVLLRSMSIDYLEQRCRQLVLHSRINYAYRRMREYLETDNTWGGMQCRRAVGPARGLFLGRVWPARIGADLFRRLGHFVGRPHQERLGPGNSADWHRPVLRSGIFPPAARQPDGWQQEDYLDLDSADIPIQPATGPTASRSRVSIETGPGWCRPASGSWPWGGIILYLLDSDVPGNAPEDRELTARLYGGDTRTRIRQELLLGVGGVRALEALGIAPGVVHLNEGHSAFAVLELMRQSMEREGATVDEAMRRVPAARCSPRTRRCRPVTIGFPPT